MKRERSVEYMLTLEEVRLISAHRKKQIRRSIRRRRLEQRIKQIATILLKKEGGTILILLGIVSSIILKNHMAPGEVKMVSTIFLVFGIRILLIGQIRNHSLRKMKR